MAGRSQLTGPVGLDDPIDIQQILLEAKRRWLRPAEICVILQNHKKLRISSEPATTPPGGSLFLFDRKVLRYFRRDGHNWKKKKDGKTLMEWNEKLKLEVGGVNVLHCYYARGEENKNLHRRSYWMLEKSEGTSRTLFSSTTWKYRTKEYRNTVESENEVDKSRVPLQARLDSYMPWPSHDQLFSIVDFAPNCGYENSETKVLITGRFLNGQHSENCKWLCMFGEVEVSAEVIGDGVLRCYAPPQKAGTLPFFLICSNRPRLACSQEKKFEYLPKDYYSNCSTEALNMRFEKLLSSSSTSPNCDPTSMAADSELSCKISCISSLLINDNDQGDNVLQYLSDGNVSWRRVNEQSLQPLKKRLHAWLLQKMASGGKGLSVLDKGGQGVLHFGAALGYDWVLLPTINAGVSVDFPDGNGWTALHWAAFFGREDTVAALISLGAAPGALTVTGETPAELASEQKHFGIIQKLQSSPSLS